MIFLLLCLPLIIALDPTPSDINKLCYKCNVYSAAGKMKCENPGVCYANLCYSYVASDGTTMFLSGCAEDISDFSVRDISQGIVCQSSGGVALCVCATGKNACNYPDSNILNDETEQRDIRWIEDDDERKMDNISSKVTGFSVEYAKRRIEHLKQDGWEKIPKHFNMTRITNGAGTLGIFFTILLLSK